MKNTFLSLTLFALFTIVCTPTLASMDQKPNAQEPLLEEFKSDEKLPDRILRFIFQNIFCYGYNSHEINEHAYRSGFMPLEVLENFINNNGIDVLVNLRGEQKEKYWHKTLQNADAELINLTFSSHKAPEFDEFLKFVRVVKQAIRNGQKHLFVDKDGSNRTGLAGALDTLLTQIVLSNKYWQNEAVMNKAIAQFGFWKYFYIWMYHICRSESVDQFAVGFGRCYIDLIETLREKYSAEVFITEEMVESIELRSPECESSEYKTWAIAAYKIMHLGAKAKDDRELAAGSSGSPVAYA